MKHKIITSLALLINIHINNAVAADFNGIDGADLKKICTSYVDIPANTSDGMCIGYVVGVMSIMEYINVLCRPVNSTHAQATLVVQKHLFDHPERLHLNAEDLVLDALLDAFPCTEAN